MTGAIDPRDLSLRIYRLERWAWGDTVPERIAEICPDKGDNAMPTLADQDLRFQCLELASKNLPVCDAASIVEVAAAFHAFVTGATIEKASEPDAS